MDWLAPFFSSKARLGPLESELLHALWRRGDATVRELIDESRSSAAYTTVMTTLDRLFKKGVLKRSPEGRAFRYRPAQSEEEFKRSQVAEGLKLLLRGGQRHAPVSFLVEEISKHDAELLDELQRAIDDKRRELKKRSKA